MISCLSCANYYKGICLVNETNRKIIDGELYCDSYSARTTISTNGTAPILSEKTDNVNHPAHYETGKFECFDVMIETQGKEAVLNFCICNAFKYIYRFRNKGGDEDIKKANWYLSKYLELRESE